MSEPSAVTASGDALLDRRRAGILLHPTALPSGTLGEDAERFLDWLQRAGFTAWQMLPLGPVGPHGSPYSSASAFASNVCLLPASVRAARVDPRALADFRAREAYWLEDYACFEVARSVFGGRPWWVWPTGLRERAPNAMRDFADRHAAAMQACCADQFRFAHYWSRLRHSATARGIRLIGDLPMFVVADSVDVWAHRALFRLDRHGRPTSVAGVPPDYFSSEGQCWDNPVYDWAAHQKSLFEWWVERLRRQLACVDQVRWDHFRGLTATWEIPLGTDGLPVRAVDGGWRAVPGRALLGTLKQELGRLPVIAENLGDITSEVENLRHDFGLPGLHVLQFAFDGSQENPHLPANHEALGVALTGTHDNDTTCGWWNGLDQASRAQVADQLDLEPAIEMPDALIDVTLASCARLAMLPAQDLLGLGSEARMNRPGVAEGQWRWRLSWAQLNAAGADLWRRRIEAAGRV